MKCDYTMKYSKIRVFRWVWLPKAERSNAVFWEPPTIGGSENTTICMGANASNQMPVLVASIQKNAKHLFL
jgi:hypothetical protein